MTEPKLIVVDDEEGIAKLVCDVSERVGYLSEHYQNADDFINNYSDAEVIVLDLLLPGIDGIELIRFLAKKSCQAHILLISGFDSSVLLSAQKLASEQGLNFYASLNKPFRQRELLEVLEALRAHPLQKASKQSHNYVPKNNELHEALLHNEIVVHYQPKINLHNGHVEGVEALARWQHQEHGLIPPDNFIPFAEENGLIDALTWMVLQEAAKQCQQWNNLGLELSAAVNMSAGTLCELSLPEYLNKLINAHSISPEQIIMEVTETVLMQELVKSLDILTRLRMKGFHLSIDDFGTGYSSLVQLHRAPFSELKIDRSFVQAMATDKEARAIVETVIVLGHKLEMNVLAEGVENQGILDQLTQMGCDMAQGYHISRPQSGPDITDWLLQHTNLPDNIKKTNRPPE